MRISHVAFVVLGLPLSACGGSDSRTPSGTSASHTPAPSGTSVQTASFDPPPVADGYTRLLSKTVPNVLPGGDVTYCQYVMAPLDHDVDLMGVVGYQSKFGHHAAAFTYKPQADETPGSSFPCMGTEFTAGGDPMGGTMDASGAFSMGAYLGGVGGEGGGKPSGTLPDGVAFRLKQGNGIMLNVHYLNTGDTPIDGNAVVDLKMADADPGRKIASMFVNLNLGFDLPANGQTTSAVDCVAKSDLQIIMMSNHMHEHGTNASTEVVHADGTVESLHVDDSWTFDMQFNPTYSHWAVDSPFVLQTGDTIRTSCTWDNTTPNEMKFPREMCLGVGFALSTNADATVPMCLNGLWVPQGL